MIFDVIHDTFVTMGKTWNIGGKDVVPTSEDIETVVDRAVGMMYADSVGAQLQVGGLIIEKSAEGYEIFTHIATYN